MQSITVEDATPADLHELVYAYDSVLNVDTVQEFEAGAELLRSGSTSPGWDFDYDDVYRLNEALYPESLGLPAREDFAYDGAGNRDEANSATKVPLGTSLYNGNNEITNSPSSTTYVFDEDGNLASRTVGSVTDTYDFDTGNRLRAVHVNQETTPSILYDYDPFGRRLRKSENGNVTS